MTTPIKLTLSDELAARLDAARGLHSRQEFITLALIGTIDGTPAERELRAQVERLTQALERIHGAQPVTLPVREDNVLSW